MSFIKQKLEIALRKFFQLRSRIFLSKIPVLWNNLQIYLEKTESTGCSYIDYAELYRAIRRNKPTQVLECGTGVSTLVIAHALMQNEKETNVRGTVTSMEEHPEWHKMSKNLLPAEYEPYVEILLSKTKDDYFSVFRGVRYSELPQIEYDFVFVDGPKYISKTDDGASFDFDLLHVVRNANKPVSALIDKRVSTVFVLQKLLGVEKVYYSSIKGLGFVKSVSKKDLGNISSSISSSNFTKSFHLLGNSKLEITATQTIGD